LTSEEGLDRDGENGSGKNEQDRNEIAFQIGSSVTPWFRPFVNFCQIKSILLLYSAAAPTQAIW